DRRLHRIGRRVRRRGGRFCFGVCRSGGKRLAPPSRGDQVGNGGGVRRVIGQALLDEAASLVEACRAGQVKVAIAEGCTGGLVAAVLTAIAGSSEVLERGFIPHSNAAKIELLGVPADLIAEVGAVSEPVARRMAEGARLRSNATIA